MDDFPDTADTDALHSELVQFLVNNRQMRQTARSALKQGLWAGSGAIAGGMIGGPVGGLVGGIAGSIVGFVKSDPYDGILTQISKLESSQRAGLVREVGGVLMTAGAAQGQLVDPVPPTIRTTRKRAKRSLESMHERRRNNVKFHI